MQLLLEMLLVKCILAGIPTPKSRFRILRYGKREMAEGGCRMERHFLFRKVFLLFLALGCFQVSPAKAEDLVGMKVGQATINLPNVKFYLDLSGASGQPLDAVDLANLSGTCGTNTLSITSGRPFDQTGEGVAYVFLVDISRSLTSVQLEEMKKGLRNWIGRMKSNDRGALMLFGESVTLQQDYTASKESLLKAIGSLELRDNRTQLHQGIAKAIELARRTDPDNPVRRAIITLSDGEDDFVGGMTGKEVLDLMREDRIPIYAIGFLQGSGGIKARENLKKLGEFARVSGGEFFEGGQIPISAIYDKVQDKIMRSFVVESVCKECVADGKAYRLQVNVVSGGRRMSDGVDMRLVPTPPPSRETTKAVVEKTGGFMGIWTVVGVGLVFFILVGLLVYKKRKNDSGGKMGSIPDDAENLYKLGWKYYAGDGVEQNVKKAVDLFRSSAEKGFAPAQNTYSTFLYAGEVVSKDEKEALRWLKKAAENGDADAQFMYGSKIENGEDGLPQNDALAANWYSKSAEQGYAMGQFHFGVLVFEGRGRQKNEEEGLRWIGLAAKQGDEHHQQVFEELNSRRMEAGPRRERSPNVDDLESRTEAIIDAIGAGEEEDAGGTDLESFWRGVISKTSAETGLNLISSIEKNKTKTQILYRRENIKGLFFVYYLKAQDWVVRLDIDFGADKDHENERFFDRLQREAASIEKVFGQRLAWEKGKGRACRIICPSGSGGFKSPEKWSSIQDRMVDSMARLEKAVGPVIDRLA